MIHLSGHFFIHQLIISIESQVVLDFKHQIWLNSDVVCFICSDGIDLMDLPISMLRRL